MDANELTTYLDDFLALTEFEDYGPQGLQVEAAQPTVTRLALAVDVAPPIIQAAADWSADMLLVHHGILWGALDRIAGPLGARVRLLLTHGIHLYAAHLALDAHPEVGNNAVLARALGITVDSWWCAPRGAPLGILGQAPAGTTRMELVASLAAQLGRQPRLLPQGPEKVAKVAIVSGFAADQIGAARALGADTFITGETSHQNYWAADDHGINVIFGGHYATETVGVKALGAHLKTKFGLETRFFDFPTDM